MNLIDYWLTSLYNKMDDYLVIKMQKENVDIKGNHNHSKSLGIFLSSAFFFQVLTYLVVLNSSPGEIFV